MAQKSQYYSSFVKALWLEELAVGHGPRVMPRAHCPLGLPPLVTRVPGGSLAHVICSAELNSAIS